MRVPQAAFIEGFSFLFYLPYWGISYLIRKAAVGVVQFFLGEAGKFCLEIAVTGPHDADAVIQFC